LACSARKPRSKPCLAACGSRAGMDRRAAARGAARGTEDVRGVTGDCGKAGKVGVSSKAQSTVARQSLRLSPKRPLVPKEADVNEIVPESHCSEANKQAGETLDRAALTGYTGCLSCN